MTLTHRAAGAGVALLAVCALATSCGQQRAGASPGSASHAVAAMGSAAAARCPARQPVHPVSDVPGTGRELEPLVADRVLLCRYDGPPKGPHPGALTGHALVTAASRVTALRAEFNRLGQPPKGRLFCPNDTGAAVLAVFSAGAREVQIIQKTTGCQMVTNGTVTRWAGDSGVLATVLRLLS